MNAKRWRLGQNPCFNPCLRGSLRMPMRSKPDAGFRQRQQVKPGDDQALLVVAAGSRDRRSSAVAILIE